MLEAQVDRYAVQAGFFESEDGMDFLPDVQEISFYVAPAMETKTLHSLADSLAEVARSVIVSVYTPESEAFAWFDAQGVRVTSHHHLLDVWRTDPSHRSAHLDHQMVLFHSSLPEFREPSLAVSQADSRQCVAQSNVSQGGRSGELPNVDGLIRDPNTGGPHNDGDETPMQGVESTSAVTIASASESMEEPSRKAFTISSTSVVLATFHGDPVVLDADDERSAFIDEYVIGLEMTAVMEVSTVGFFCAAQFSIIPYRKMVMHGKSSLMLQNFWNKLFRTRCLNRNLRKLGFAFLRALLVETGNRYTASALVPLMCTPARTD
jgi:hypothetical protein